VTAIFENNIVNANVLGFSINDAKSQRGTRFQGWQVFPHDQEIGQLLFHLASTL
jgi:hypothetical protein